MIHSSHPGQSRHKQGGVSLVEVLVTLVVISVGLLGIAALHLTSLRNSQDANIRSKAVWLANDIIERMRSNRVAARAGDYVAPPGGSVAASDVTAWRAALTDPMLGPPSGTGTIAVATVGNNRVFTITVQWTERDGSHTFVTQTEI